MRAKPDPGLGAQFHPNVTSGLRLWLFQGPAWGPSWMAASQPQSKASLARAVLFWLRSHTAQAFSFTEQVSRRSRPLVLLAWKAMAIFLLLSLLLSSQIKTEPQG